MKLKKVIAAALAILVIATFAGCSKKTDDSNGGSTTSAGELSGKITVWSWDVALKSLQESAENFKKLHPKVEFQFEDLANDQIYDKLTTGLAANIGLPDVVSIEGERVATFGAKFPQGFVDFTSEVTKTDFIPSKLAECTVNGKVIAYPWDAAPCALYYRTDYFKQAGINAEDIKTWDDFINAGIKMNKIGVKMVPITVSKNDGLFRLILNQQGAFYFDKDGKTILNGEAAVKAMAMLKKMVDAGIYFDNTNWDGLVSATKSGKIATVPTAVWWTGTLQSDCKESSGKWAVMRLPSMVAGENNAAVNGGSELMVPSATQNKEAAVAFTKFAMTDQASLINGFTKYGLYPSYTASYSDPVFEQGVDYFSGQKVWKLFSEVAKEIPDVNFTENFAEANTYAIDAQARVLVKGADVKATMDELQKNIVTKFGK